MVADGAHHAAWSGLQARQATILDTRSGARRTANLPGVCSAAVEPFTESYRRAASGRVLLACNSAEGRFPQVVLSLASGSVKPLPSVPRGEMWRELGAFWAVREASCATGKCRSYVNLADGRIVERPAAEGPLDLDSPELPRAPSCRRVTFASAYPGEPLGARGRSFDAVVRARRELTRWRVERLSCRTRKIIARERLAPQSIQARGGLLSWTTATDPFLALENGPGRGAIVAVSRTDGARIRRWRAPRRTFYESADGLLGAYGVSAHTQERIFYAAALDGTGNISGLNSQAVYSRPVPDQLRPDTQKSPRTLWTRSCGVATDAPVRC